MSGDINTSLGNCLIMCGLVHQYAAERGVVIDLANNGDDCVVFLERRQLGRFMARLSEWFLDYGFSMKVEEPVDEFEGVEFCQTKPVFTGERWVMCRGPTGLSKDTYSLLPLQQGNMAYGWATAIADSGEAIASDMPIYSALYARLRSLGQGITLGNHPLMTQGGLYWLSQGERAQRRGITTEARVSFWKAFKIPPYMQILAENHCMAVQMSMSTRGVSLKNLPEYIDPCVASLRHYVA